jgi:hypothetical protein
MIKLDDCSILQHDHLVGNRPSPECMTYSVFENSASQGPNCSRVRLMGHAPMNT